MNNTDKFFIQCLSDHLNKRTTKIPEFTIDIDYLYSLSKNHDLIGIIYYQLKRTSLELQLFQKPYYTTVFYYVRRKNCFEKVAEELKRNDLEYTVVKGPKVANLYPVPDLRTMGDIDLLIHEKDKEKIHQVMLSLDYTCINDTNTRDWDYKNEIIEFEMHPLLIYPDEQVEKKEYIQFFNNFWSYLDEKGELKKEFHLLYLLVHLRKHLLNHGAGMRQFMDIAVFTRAYQDQLDWNWIEEKLEYLSLKKFTETVYSFIELWFEFKSPLKNIDINDEFYIESTDRILKNGVFGFQAEDDKNALVSYAMANEGKLGKMKYYLKMVFPNYGAMRIMNEYSFIEGKPFLLPIAWIIRLFKIISKGSIKEKIDTINADSSSDRVHMIEMWGMK